MSKFLTVKYHKKGSELSSPKNNSPIFPARAIKINLFDENDIPCYPIYEIFNEKFPDFICQICLSFVLDPVECLTCNAIFCRKCLYEYTLYSKHCPNRCDINYRPVNRILRNIINAVKVPCIYFHKGCKEILTFEIYDRHLKQCEFGPYMCNECYLVDVKENVENHIKICQKLKIEKDFSRENEKRFVCKHCNLDIITLDEKSFWYDEFKMNKYVKKFLMHEYLCNEQIVLCTFCDKNFRLYDFMRHTENNLCIINQLNNKVNYLMHKINYYESNIKNKKILNDEEEMKNFKEMSQIKKVDLPFSKRYGITQSLITNLIKQEEQNEIKNIEKQKHKEKFIKENSVLDKIGKTIIKEVNTKSKTFNEKNNEIISLIISKDTNDKDNKYLIFSSFKTSFKIEKDLINENNSEIINNAKYDMNEITEILSKNKYNKVSSIAINHLILTELNKKKDLFITTDSSHYFLFNNELNKMIQWGRPTSSTVTCLTELTMPKDKYYIVLGTLSSNVQFLDPYSNKIIYTLNHTKKRIISLCYHSYSMTLITSSAKENAFYLWKYSCENDIFELKSTIKDNNSWIWSIILVNLNINSNSNDEKDLNYIVTGGGDKSINLWEFFPNENAVLKKLTIKEHHESVIKVLYVKINNNCIIISGAFDGTIKLHSIKRTFNDEYGEIKLISKELITIYNKDSEIVNLDYFLGDNITNDDDGDDTKREKEINLVVNFGRSKGYFIHKINFIFC